MQSKTIRVFLSSTFQDMRAERDALHSDRVQGALRRLCAQSGFQFQLIDLRWGISDEASMDQQAEQLCLREIRRCEYVTPRPNFVALLGQRYGWRPLPHTLTPSDWHELYRASPDTNTRHLISDWYRLDANNIPDVYRLRPRSNERERDPTFWHESVEYPLLNHILHTLSDPHFFDRFSAQLLNDTGLSLTEKEIRVGAEHAEKAEWSAFAYARTIGNYAAATLPPPFKEPECSSLSGLTVESLQNADALRYRLKSNQTVHYREYTASLFQGEVDRQYLKRLCDDVYADLASAIQQQIRDYESQDGVDLEASEHTEIAQTHRANYVSRPREEQIVSDYIRAHRSSPLIVGGRSGSGKTAFMANTATKPAEPWPNAVIVTRFIGASRNSSRLGPLVRSIYAETARRTGNTPEHPSDTGTPGFWLGRALEFGTAERPLVIIVDGLDQLNDEPHARSGQWLPKTIPEHSRLVLSCMAPERRSRAESESIDSVLRQIMDQDAFCEIGDPSNDDAERMLCVWLESFDRTVTTRQFRSLVRAIRRNPRPLYVRILAELARSWSTDYAPGKLPRTTAAALSTFLDKLEDPGNHGRLLVEKTLGWLLVSRSGLAESELVNLMESDDAIQEWFVHTRHQPYPDGGDTLPPAIWSRLLFDLSPFLQERTVLSDSLTGFYHRQLAEAARSRYLGKVSSRNAYLDDLINYLQAQSAWRSRESAVPNVRYVYEFPHQLIKRSHPKAADRLESFLTEPLCIEAKLTAGLHEDLVNDYADATITYPDKQDRLVPFFSNQLLSDDSVIGKRLRPDDLHSFLVYRNDSGAWKFYHGILEQLVSNVTSKYESTHAIAIRARAHVDLAGIERRQAHHARARALLEILGHPEHGLTPSAQGTGWYELAYIDYLEGEFKTARERFQRSVQADYAAGDSVGAAISRTLQAWSGYFENPTEAALSQVNECVTEVLPIFRAESQQDPRAARWVMNGLAHLANCAYLAGDRQNLDEKIRELASDPWIQQFGDPSLLQDYRARLAQLNGDYARAAELWQDRFSRQKDWKASQSFAWRLSDYGESLYRLGQRVAGTAMFLEALAQPAWRGNSFWQSRVRRQLSTVPRLVRLLGTMYRFSGLAGLKRSVPGRRRKATQH